MREVSCRNQGETKQCLMPSGTNSRCNKPHADETWMCWRWRNRRWRKGIATFLWVTSECGDANSGNFVGTACSTAAWKFWVFGQLFHQRTGIAHNATWNIGSSLGDPIQHPGPQQSANDVLRFCYKGKIQPCNEYHRVEERAAEIPWKHST